MRPKICDDNKDLFGYDWKADLKGLWNRIQNADNVKGPFFALDFFGFRSMLDPKMTMVIPNMTGVIKTFQPGDFGVQFVPSLKVIKLGII